MYTYTHQRNTYENDNIKEYLVFPMFSIYLCVMMTFNLIMMFYAFKLYGEFFFNAIIKDKGFTVKAFESDIKVFTRVP